jgi:hypothetical protein
MSRYCANRRQNVYFYLFFEFLFTHDYLNNCFERASLYVPVLYIVITIDTGVKSVLPVPEYTRNLGSFV